MKSCPVCEDGVVVYEGVPSRCPVCVDEGWCPRCGSGIRGETCSRCGWRLEDAAGSVPPRGRRQVALACLREMRAYLDGRISKRAMLRRVRRIVRPLTGDAEWE